jgi:uncharacterized protein (TIGR02246 family)
MGSKASSLVDKAKKWATHYGEFTSGDAGAALTAPLRVRGAWESNDANVLADAFTENGSMLVGDEQLKGREEIRAYWTDAFANYYKGSRIEDDPDEIVFFDENTALVISKGGVLKEGETAVPVDRENRNTWVVVREQGDWKLFSYQSSPIKG